MKQWVLGMLRTLGLAAMSAFMLGAMPAAAATIDVGGGALTQQASSSFCYYASMQQDTAGNWNVVCGAGSRTITFTPNLYGTRCTSYTSMTEDVSGNWTVSGCVSPVLPPSVTLAAPATSGQTYTGGVPFTLAATATPSAGRSISRVDFYRDGSVHVGQASWNGAQYVLTWNPGAGTFNVFARATDSGGLTGDSVSRQMTFAYAAPGITLDAPATSGATYLAGAAYQLKATASIPAGQTLSRIEFYRDSEILLGTGASIAGSQYGFTWTPAAGTYQVYAKVFTSAGTTAATSSRQMNVTAGGSPPTLTLGAACASTCTAPASVTLTAQASDPDGISRVELLEGTTLLATLTTAPYVFTVNGVTQGAHTYTARAYDSLNSSATASSAPVTVSAGSSPPYAVSLSAMGYPLVAPANVTLRANVAAAAGSTGVSVNLYRDGQLVGSMASAGWNPDTGHVFTYVVPSLAAGSYRYTATATNASATSVNSNAATVTVDSGSMASAPNTCMAEQFGQDLPGATAGSASINESGAATYSIPIATPPGINGMTPSLSLAYNSQFGSTLVAPGWAVNGLSMIHRCMRTHLQDQAKGPLTYANLDPLCIDGQRLIPLGGARDGTVEYRTERDTYARIQSFNPAPGAWAGPAHFKVELKNGQILYYGFRPEDHGQNAVVRTYPFGATSESGRFWGVYRIEDRSGNYITIEYQTENQPGQMRPSVIRYTGNSATGAQPFAEVRFEYEDRPGTDNPTFYDGGGQTSRLDKRLSAIATYADGVAVKRYNLRYNTPSQSVTSHALLAGVQECSGDNVSCHRETTFSWTAAPFPTDIGTRAPTLPSGEPGSLWAPFAADFNGDGRTDYLYRMVDTSPTSMTSSWRLCLANPQGDSFSCSQTALPTLVDSDENGSRRYLIEAGDFDGDGRVDMAFYLTSIGYESPPDNGGGEAIPGEPMSLAKKKDTIKGKGAHRIKPGSRLPKQNNGQGQGKALGVDDSPLAAAALLPVEKSLTPDTWKICLSTGANFNCFDRTLVKPGHDASSIEPSVVTNTGDFDGDGRTDLAIRVVPNGALDQATWNICMAVGGGSFNCYDQPDLLDNVIQKTVQVGDMNADGRADFIALREQLVNPNSDEFSICMSHSHNGVPAFSCHVDQIFKSAEDFGVATTDFNGDGISDLAFTTLDPTPGVIKGYYVCLGLGNGRFDACQPWSDAYPEDNHRFVVGDFNGDGRSDVIDFRPTGNTWTANHMCLSVGTRFNCRPVAGGYIPALQDYLFAGDFSGDGKSDIVWRTNNVWQHWRSPGAFPDLLSKVTNGLGHEVQFAYAPLTDPSVYAKSVAAITYPELELQSPMYVVKRLSTGLGYAGEPYHTDHTYRGLRGRAAGGPLGGFVSRATRDPQNTQCTETTTETVYVSRRIGLTKSVVKSHGATLGLGTCQGGLLANRSSFTWSHRVLTPGVNEHFLTTKVDEAWDVLPNSTTVALPVTTTSTPLAEIDAFGNTRRVEVTVQHAGQQFRKTTLSTFENNTGNWIIGKLRRADVTSEVPYATVNSGTATRVSAFTYTAAGLLWTETIEPDRAGTSQWQQTTYTFDAYGNRETSRVQGLNVDRLTTLKHCSEATVSSGDGCTVDGRFPTFLKNAMNHVERHVYDRRFGTVRSATSPNGLVTTKQHDRMGRMYCETRGDGSSTGDGSTTGFQWHWFGDGGAYYAVTKDSTQAEVQQHFDRLHREVVSKSKTFDGAFSTSSTVFDARGRKQQVSKPFGSTTGTTTFGYDHFDRVISETGPGGHSVTYDYNGLTTTVRSGNGLAGARFYQSVKKTTVNARGEPIEIEDARQNKLQLQYDFFGNLERKRVVAGSEGGSVNDTLMYFNNRGQKTAMSDPDQGSWSYQYNGVGEMTRQDAPGGQTTTYQYDNLGRMIQRSESTAPGMAAAYNSSWDYDTQGGAACGTKSVGKLCRASGSQATQEYRYDKFARLAARRMSTARRDAIEASFGYDAMSRVREIIYPITGARLVYNYNAAGYLASISEPGRGGHVHWQVDSRFADGQLAKQFVANSAFTTWRTYDAMGRPFAIITNSATAGIHNVNYAFDALGNLVSRNEAVTGLSEGFEYDPVNRLRNVTGSSTKSYVYDGLGNLTSKSDVGSYTLVPGTHRVSTAGGTTYGYLANGFVSSITNAQGTTQVVPTPFLMPATISRGAATLEFLYDTERQRVTEKRADRSTTIMLSGTKPFFEEEVVNGVAKWKHFVDTPEGVVSAFTIDVAGNIADQIFHRDHLGSTVAVSDASGTQQLGYDAWGRRRNANGTDNASAPTGGTNRGFTGHEHLDDFGLVHMNGRIYDPIVARFLSADPIIQAPLELQSYNRYSYVLNNPLSFTDPSGFSWWTKWRRPILALVAVWFLGPGGFFGDLGVTGLAVGGNAGASAVIAGFAAGGIMGGNMESAITGAFSGLMFYAAGSLPLLEGAEWMAGPVQRAATHAFAGCFSNSIAGGSCGQGALAAGFAKLAGAPAHAALDQYLGEAVTMGLVSAAAARVAGGDATTAFVTASLSYLLNDAGHNYEAGKAAEAKVLAQVRLSGVEVVEQVRLRVGVIEAVADYAYVIGDRIYFGEVKDGSGARFTTNQKFVYGEIAQGRAVVIDPATKAKLGLQAEVKYLVNLTVHAETGSRALRQAARMIGMKGLVAGTLTILGGPAVMAAEFAFGATEAGRNSDCVGCLNAGR